MDGTMVDNMMIHHKAWQNTLKNLGLDLTISEVQQSVHGINDEILIRLFGERFTREERKLISAEKELEYRNIFKPKLELINGLSQFLNSLHDGNIPMGIGSAAPKENVDFVLDNLGIRHMFNTVLDASSVDRGKPDPEIYLKVADGMNLSSSDCLVFEDSPTGAEAASRAGCKQVILTSSHEEK